ncbi:lipase lipl-1-like [Rhipicephalus microplus]|uniref:lipase lipl-1-like n=1 Tax=Rhipicephalus microplus TaxID=6941 RepID=UPI003F6AF375
MVAIAKFLPRFVVTSFGLALNLTSRLVPDRAKVGGVCTGIEFLISDKGYPLETHEVTTEDGYILQMHRIPHGRMGSCAHVSATNDRWCGGRGSVFVMTGLLADSASLVLDLPDQSLGKFVLSYCHFYWLPESKKLKIVYSSTFLRFVLADKGYDVWLGNTRGNTFGRRHRTLNVRSRQFWNFTFHEHALYDLPAQIDYVLRNTGQRRLLYIGFSQGTLSFFTLMSERPEYNDKVLAFAGLAPFNKLAHIEVPPLAILGPYAESALRLAQAMGGYEMLPKDLQLTDFLRLLCGGVAKRVCAFLGDRLGNVGSQYINQTRATTYMCHIPAGTSTKNIIHFGQLVRSKRPQKYDYGASKNQQLYGQRKPPEYNLSRVTTDVGVFWSKGDQFVTPQEVDELRADLRPRLKREEYIDDPFYTHLHFLMGLASKKALFRGLLDFLGGYSTGQSRALDEDVSTTTNVVDTTLASKAWTS